MPEQTATSQNSYVGDGATTSFDFDFLIVDESHLKVLVAGVIQTLGSNYYVRDVGNPNGGRVIFTLPPAISASIKLIQDAPLTQERDHTNYVEAYKVNSTDGLDIIMQGVKKVWREAFRLEADDQLSELTEKGTAVAADRIFIEDSADGWLKKWVSLNNIPGGGSGVTDHGALTGLADDDHTQYHNDARGDARYSLLAHNHDADYAAISHNHDADYSAIGHTHTESDITDYAPVAVLEGYGSQVNMIAALSAAQLYAGTGSTTAAIHLRAGDQNTGSLAWHQMSLGYAGGDNYQHYISTRHNASADEGNAIEFWTGDGTPSGTFASNKNFGFQVQNGRMQIGGTPQRSGSALPYTLDVQGDANIDSDLAVGGTVDGVDIAARDHDSVTLAGSLDYLTLSGQEITLGAIDLTADVTGNLPSTNLDLGMSPNWTGVHSFYNHFYMEEQAAASTDYATFGQFWVRNDTPCTPMFTDDAGTDHVLNSSGSGDAWGDAVDADIIPDADGTRDLGSTGTRFAEAYVDSLDVTDDITLNGGVVTGQGIVYARGTSTATMDDVEADLTWDTPAIGSSHDYFSVSGSEITCDTACTAKFTVSIRSTNANRTELLLRTYHDTGSGWTHLPEYVMSNYISRDTDQNTGGFTHVVVLELSATDKVEFRGFGDTDGTCTLVTDGTNLLIEVI